MALFSEATEDYTGLLLKTDYDIICAVESFNYAVQQAIWKAMLTSSNPDSNIEYSCSTNKISRKKEASQNMPN